MAAKASGMTGCQNESSMAVNKTEGRRESKRHIHTHDTDHMHPRTSEHAHIPEPLKPRTRLPTHQSTIGTCERTQNTDDNQPHQDHKAVKTTSETQKTDD
uniref:Uncharacterized protein n=1 Tax=Eutreptiella gymnastica TaxID=73025 RepID=A0A7S4C850_9EUGL